jgi:hypothetical protein
MIQALRFEGLTYVATKDAAVGSNLSTEYLARLARSGRLSARMAAGMWFIEMHSLQQFVSTRKKLDPRKTAGAPGHLFATRYDGANAISLRAAANPHFRHGMRSVP